MSRKIICFAMSMLMLLSIAVSAENVVLENDYPVTIEGNFPKEIQVIGNFMFVYDKAEEKVDAKKILVYDVSNPEEPVQLDDITHFDSEQRVKNMVARDNYLYVAWEYWLVIYEVTDTIQMKGAYDYFRYIVQYNSKDGFNWDNYTMSLSANDECVVVGFSSEYGSVKNGDDSSAEIGYFIISASNAELSEGNQDYRLTMLYSYSMDSSDININPFAVKHVLVDGDYLYTVGSNESPLYPGTLAMFDISSPASPILKGTHEISYIGPDKTRYAQISSISCAKGSDYIFMGVSDNQVDPNYSRGIGGTWVVYTGTAKTSGGVITLNAAVKEQGDTDRRRVSDVYVQGDLLYIVRQDERDMLIFEIPENPISESWNLVYVSGILASDGWGANISTINGHYIYAVDYWFENGLFGTIKIIKIKNEDRFSYCITDGEDEIFDVEQNMAGKFVLKNYSGNDVYTGVAIFAVYKDLKLTEIKVKEITVPAGKLNYEVFMEPVDIGLNTLGYTAKLFYFENFGNMIPKEAPAELPRP